MSRSIKIRQQMTGAHFTGAHVTGARAIGARLIGPTAMGPLAIAVCAIGAIAIGRVTIANAVIRRLRAEEIEIREGDRLRLAVHDVHAHRREQPEDAPRLRRARRVVEILQRDTAA